MGIVILKLGKPSPLMAGEQVVHEQWRFRAVSSTTFPSYRIGFNLPPLWRISLIVTDRRCLVVTDLCHCMTQEIVMWYPRWASDEDPETITQVSCQKGLFGRCLEIRTRNPRRRQRWLWSPELTLRFFLKEPDAIEVTIRAQMAHQESALEDNVTSQAPGVDT